MSEYWKSNPRKFCDFCKCWIADNKPSIDFHERGKRHKENVQKRLAEMGRKGQEEHEARLQEDDFIKSMEEAAMKAYKTDIEKNPDMMGAQISEIAKASNAELIIGKKTPTTTTTTTSSASTKPKTSSTSNRSVIAPKKWHEAKSPDGTSYYWNTETGESSWEEPQEGFLSICEQEKLTNKTQHKSSLHTASQGSTNKTIHSASQQDSISYSKHESQSTLSDSSLLYGPAPKAEAYSCWKTIETEKEEAVDLQLPDIPAEQCFNPPAVSMSRQEVSFKEKVVTLSSQEGAGPGGNVGFKKRKVQQDNKKIMKRRNDL